ncbi:hypothetical protein, partial [Klebsiella quasipneumoniae]|uniref:hypothetical protein n=1 Tax=Klebsiella quasipneumoniae TaxID=1463165 RepID=UPI002ABB9822
YAPVKAKLKGQIWLLRSSKPVTAVQRVGSSENLRKTALQGGFSKVLRATNSLNRGNWLGGAQ